MSRLKKEILSKLKEYAGKMGKDHLGGDDSPSPKRGGLRDFDGYDNVDYNQDMPMDEDSPESAHPQGSKKLTNRTTVMDMLDVISHKEFGPDYHKLSTKQKKEVHKLAIKGKLIKQSPFKESVVTEAKDNLYLQLHKKYAKQIKGLKAKKIKKLTDLVSVQRWSMEEREDYFGMDSKKKKELSKEYDTERKLFKKYIGGDESVMLPKGTETLSEESVNEASDTYFKTAGEAVDFAKTKAEKKGYEIDEDDWNNQITHGGRYSRLRPSVGKTHTFQIGLLKKGKPQRKGLSISLFGMDSGNYELTYYIN